MFNRSINNRTGILCRSRRHTHQISHAIIVSRELGLPCVVSVEHATDQIPNGATIEVNGATGKITIIELP